MEDENIADSITAHAIDFIDKYKKPAFFSCILLQTTYMYHVFHMNVLEVRIKWEYVVMLLPNLTGQWDK